MSKTTDSDNRTNKRKPNVDHQAVVMRYVETLKTSPENSLLYRDRDLCKPDDLRPLVATIVTEALAQLRADETALGDRLAFSEQEAARLLGLESHQLRDERLRGRIAASQIVGRRIRYRRDDLISYLARHRTEPRT